MASLERRFAEQPVLLGRRRSIVAVIAHPRPPSRSDEPAVVILNTGIVHRVGHHRMYVSLSRLLASRGRVAVRFDLSGIGDSTPRGDGLPPLEASLADIGEVLDSLEELHQISRFVLVGLCSGADQAVLYARTDPRVTGLVVMDPTLPPTARYYIHYVMQRVTHLRNWMSVATGRSGLLRLLLAHLQHRIKPREDPRSLSVQDLQFSPVLAGSYRAVADRGGRMLAVFTCFSARHTYERQLTDAFPEISSAVRLELLPESDHLFSSELQRARLFKMTLDWLGAG